MAVGENWFDINEERRFPFGDDALVSHLPDDIFADLHVVLPDSQADGVAPRVSSVSVGDAYVSFVLEVDGTPVAWYGGDKIVRRVLPLTPLVDGTSGTVVFGEGIRDKRLRLDLEDAFLAEGTYQRYLPQRFGVLGVDKAGSADIELEGIVELRNDTNLTISLVENVTVQTGGGPIVVPQALQISLRDEVIEDVRRVLEGQNRRRVAARTCIPAVVNYVNGVRPDVTGRLTLRVLGETIDIGGASAEIQFRTELSATRDCDDVGNTDPIPVPEQGCPPP